MSALLDLNVLIALLDPQHVHHDNTSLVCSAQFGGLVNMSANPEWCSAQFRAPRNPNSLVPQQQ